MLQDRRLKKIKINSSGRVLREARRSGGQGRVWEVRGKGVGVLTLQFEDWFRMGADPSVHSALSVLLDCLLSSYSFSYMEKKSLERQRNRAGTPTLTQHATVRLCLRLTDQ